MELLSVPRIGDKVHAEKVCLQCRKPHRTGKAFCSATCCQTYRRLDRQARGLSVDQP